MAGRCRWLVAATKPVCGLFLVAGRIDDTARAVDRMRSMFGKRHPACPGCGNPGIGLARRRDDPSKAAAKATYVWANPAVSPKFQTLPAVGTSVTCCFKPSRCLKTGCEGPGWALFSNNPHMPLAAPIASQMMLVETVSQSAETELSAPSTRSRAAKLSTAGQQSRLARTRFSWSRLSSSQNQLQLSDPNWPVPQRQEVKPARCHDTAPSPVSQRRLCSGKSRNRDAVGRAGHIIQT